MENQRNRRRKLELLPEMLPAPPPAGKLSPRERTLKSLGRLAAAAAAAATLSACKETGCGSGGYAVVDPMPPPAQCEGLVATISASGSWLPSGNILLKLSKPTMAGAAYALPASNDAGGDGAPGADGAAPSVAAAAVQLQHGSVISVTETNGALQLEIQPESGVRYVAAEIPATCPAGDETVLAEIRFEAAADGSSSQDGGSTKPKLTVALYDQ